MRPSAESPIPTKHLRLLSLLLALIGCGHSEPFGSRSENPDGPFSTLFPRRLTFNVGDDRTPAWLPDGSGIVYSSEREDRLDHDRCLTVLPPDGGTILRQWCPVDPVQDDSTNLYDTPAISPEGRIFFHHVVSWIGQQKLGDATIGLSDLHDPVSATLVSRLPYTAPNGKIHGSIGTPAWIGPTSLVYLGEMLFYEGSSFYPDTFVTGLNLVRLDLGGPAPLMEIIPGTDYASSVAVSEEAGVIYYTLGGDSKVYRRDLETGNVTVVFDFGPGEIVRDVTIHGSRLVAVVGRSVLYRLELAHLEYVQRDEGGDLHIVDLNTGDHGVVHLDSTLFRHPVFSPDGTRFVVEASPYAPVHDTPDSDYNATNHRVDLWLFDLP